MSSHDEARRGESKSEQGTGALAQWIDNTISAQHMHHPESDSDDALDAEELFGSMPVGLTSSAARIITVDRCFPITRVAGTRRSRTHRKATWSPTGENGADLQLHPAVNEAATNNKEGSQDGSTGALVYRAKLDPINAVSTYEAPMSSGHVRELFSAGTSRAAEAAADSAELSSGTGAVLRTSHLELGMAKGSRADHGEILIQPTALVEPVPPNHRPVSLLRYSSAKRPAADSAKKVHSMSPQRTAGDIRAVCEPNCSVPAAHAFHGEAMRGRRKESEQLQAILESNHFLRASVRHVGVAALSHLCAPLGTDLQVGDAVDDDIDDVLGLWGAQ
jgi:hypothetical protein